MNALPFIPKPENRPAGVWDYISPSRLNLWLNCPLAFKRKYIDGVPSPTTTSLFLGKRVHQGLEIYYRHRQLGVLLEPSDVLGRLNETWQVAVAEEEMTFSGPAEEASVRTQAGDLVCAYLKHVSGEEPAPMVVETRLEAPLIDPDSGENLGIPLVGIVDLVLDGGAGATIADFKTAAKSTPPLEISHEIQLTAYAYLFRQITGREEAGLEIRHLIKTKTPQIAFHPFAARTAAHLRRFFAVVRAYLDDLEASRFLYRPGLGCSICHFRDSCCHQAGQE